MSRCVCGCGKRATHRHHVIAKAEIKKRFRGPHLKAIREALIHDPRNLVGIAHDCHWAHEAAARRLELRMLPDAVFEFAEEAMGRGAGFNYLRRMYRGEDPRLEALL